MPKKKKEEETEVRKKKKLKVAWIFGVSVIFLIILLASLISVLLIQLGVINNPFYNLHSDTKVIVIKDECTMIAGNLIHNIQDEGICEQKCKTNCDVLKMFFVSSEFAERTNDCHACICKCR